MILVDTGPLYAYVDSDDQHHRAASEFIEGHAGPLFVPILVIAEVVHFISVRLGSHAEALFLADLTSDDFLIEGLEPDDWLRVGDLVTQYRDVRLGTVDASIVATAERLGVSTIATFDRRHFMVVRPTHIDAFELVP